MQHIYMPEKERLNIAFQIWIISVFRQEQFQ